MEWIKSCNLLYTPALVREAYRLARQESMKAVRQVLEYDKKHSVPKAYENGYAEHVPAMLFANPPGEGEPARHRETADFLSTMYVEIVDEADSRILSAVRAVYTNLEDDMQARLQMDTDSEYNSSVAGSPGRNNEFEELELAELQLEDTRIVPSSYSPESP